MWYCVCMTFSSVTLAVIVVPPSDVLVHDKCIGEANLCQAVETFPLALTCYPCDDNDDVMWSFSPGSQNHFHWLSQDNKTLLLAAENVTKNKTSGCYRCQCSNGEVKKEANFSVQVDHPGR